MSTTPRSTDAPEEPSVQETIEHEFTKSENDTAEVRAEERIPPEYEAILVASREIEDDYRKEAESNQRLRREIEEHERRDDDIRSTLTEMRESDRELSRSVRDGFGKLDDVSTGMSDRFDSLEGEMVAFRKQMSDLQKLVGELNHSFPEFEQKQLAALSEHLEAASRAPAAAEPQTSGEPSPEAVDRAVTRAQSELRARFEREREDERTDFENRIRRLEASLRDEKQRRFDEIQELEAAREKSVNRIKRELEESRSENDRLRRAIESDQHVEAARFELEEHKKEFFEIIKALRSEIDYLRKVFPLRALAQAKTTEVDRYRRILRKLRPDHPERQDIELILKEQITERDDLRRQIEEADRIFDQQEKRVDDSTRFVEEKRLGAPAPGE